MRIMKPLLPLLLFLAALTTSAKPDKQLDTLQTQITALSQRVDRQARDAQSARRERAATQARTVELQAEADSLRRAVDSLSLKLHDAIKEQGQRLGTEISRTRDDATATAGELSAQASANLSYTAAAIVVLLLVALLIYIVLSRRMKRGGGELKSVREASRQMGERLVALDSQMADLMTRQLAASHTVDHSLVLSIAGEMARIEQNLAFMDPKTRGVSQLKSRAAAIQAALAKKGYEVPPLIGTEYRDGMQMEATMEEDESLEPGQQRIRRVTRPCVMYQGKMIQAAQVVVAYNPNDEQ